MKRRRLAFLAVVPALVGVAPVLSTAPPPQSAAEIIALSRHDVATARVTYRVRSPFHGTYVMDEFQIGRRYLVRITFATKLHLWFGGDRKAGLAFACAQSRNLGLRCHPISRTSRAKADGFRAGYEGIVDSYLREQIVEPGLLERGSVTQRTVFGRRTSCLTASPYSMCVAANGYPTSIIYRGWRFTATRSDSEITERDLLAPAPLT